jgi:phosphatidylserine/phosphatidylglycerophosphate/cardiolipin synthase-like enzyme
MRGKIFHNVLGTLEHDPLNGVVSPPLMGSCGVVPLTIISPLPDICRHMSNCIVRAEKEVFLATNYWQASNASTLITNALRELSRRAGERGQKVVVKIIYDRGNPKQILDNHQDVSATDYTAKVYQPKALLFSTNRKQNVKLPNPEELPHLDMQVVNYHRPVFGTFHCKYMVVDRRIAILSSNNSMYILVIS